jgi:lamin tail-like protein
VALLRWSLLGACGAGLVTCSVYTEDLLEDDGGETPCDSAADCPGADTTCGQRTCEADTCGVAFAPAATPCTEDGGKVCNGAGTCVECATEAQCAPGQSCSAEFRCQEGQADNGAPCAMPTACKSGFCVDGRCCDGVCAGACQVCNLTGSEGACTPVPMGEDPDDDCGTDVCNGAGVCRCDDNSQNGTETDTDCGGTDCPGCAIGDTCMTDDDCVSGHCPMGTCQPSPACGNMNIDPGEGCDDGNTQSFDGCSASCLDEAPHLLISELVVTPTGAEYVEIYNPTSQAISLSQIYLADLNTYYLVTQGPVAVGTSDFVVKFPNNASIAPLAFVTVAIQPAAQFNMAYSKQPDFDLAAMTGQVGSTPTLTNAAEVVILFSWNGTSDLVTDIDYVLYGSTQNAADKSGITVGASTYLPDTPVAGQAPGSAPDASGESLHRCDTAESSETLMGGNGVNGHDETSESLSSSFKITMPSPGLPPSMTLCP